MGTKTGLKENGLPAQLCRRIMGGELRNIHGWAKAFDTTPNMISRALTNLRKHNFMLYPIGGTHKEGGMVKNVIKSIRDYRETSERVTNQFTNPHILGSFRLLENLLVEDPKHHAEIEVRANKLLMMVMTHKELLLETQKEKDGTR